MDLRIGAARKLAHAFFGWFGGAKANAATEGQDTTAKDIVFNKSFSVPDSAKNLLATLQKVSPTKKLKAEPK